MLELVQAWTTWTILEYGRGLKNLDTGNLWALKILYPYQIAKNLENHGTVMNDMDRLRVVSSVFSWIIHALYHKIVLNVLEPNISWKLQCTVEIHWFCHIFYVRLLPEFYYWQGTHQCHNISKKRRDFCRRTRSLGTTADGPTPQNHLVRDRSQNNWIYWV